MVTSKVTHFSQIVQVIISILAKTYALEKSGSIMDVLVTGGVGAGKDDLLLAAALSELCLVLAANAAAAAVPPEDDRGVG